jgi:hypothetical protein
MLGRPQWVKPLVDSIRRTCDAAILFLLSPGDTSVLTAVDGMGCDHLIVPKLPLGDYARKINTGYRATSEPLLFLGAGDLLFHPGWLEAAKAKLAPGVGVVGTNDMGSPRVMAGDHSTHSLVTREYVRDFGLIDGPGLVLYEGYAHEFVDDELVGTAKMRSAWAFAPDSLVEHLHPDWGKGDRDEIHLQQQRRMRISRATFMRRRRQWSR